MSIGESSGLILIIDSTDRNEPRRVIEERAPCVALVRISPDDGINCTEHYLGSCVGGGMAHLTLITEHCYWHARNGLPIEFVDEQSQ